MLHHSKKPNRKPANTPQREAGQRHRERMAERSREQTRAAAEIGPIPKVVDPERRERCRLDLLDFLQTYFPASTGLKPFSEDHLRAIKRIEECVLHGGRFVNAFPRGYAKSTITENAAIWAVLYGHRRSVAVFGCNVTAADELVESIKMELETNDLLAEDFPEACFPIQALEGKPQRAKNQLHGGGRTHIEWSSHKVVLAEMAGSASSGAVLAVRSLMSARGMKHKRADGTQQRPDFAILDDPQTEESAGSPLLTKKRMNMLKKTVLKLGGHVGPMAVIVNATVIQPDDMVEQLLDPKLNPSWQGERIKMIRKWADSHDTWWMTDYAAVRNGFDRDRPGDQRRAHEAGNRLYEANRGMADAGAEVTWEHCYNDQVEPFEISAIQHAYNMLIDDGAEVFASECQNEPLAEEEEESKITAADVRNKLTGRKKGWIPASCTKIVGFVDSHAKLLYWMVGAIGPGFGGVILDAGTYPDPKRRYFSMRESKVSLRHKHPGLELDQAITAALLACTNGLFEREWQREDGAVMHIDRLFCDAGYKPESVRDCIRQSKHKSNIWPSLGDGITASRRPYSEYRAEKGATIGNNWRIPAVKGTKQIPHIDIDTNWWKTFAAARIAAPSNTPGSIAFWGESPERHELVADHFMAEYFVTTSGRGREVQEWFLKPSKPDNHWWDCYVGLLVAASTLGIEPLTAPAAGKKKKPKRRKKRVTYLDN